MTGVHADDPAADYLVVRQELALYNAEYCARPHIVALNKMDVDDAAQLREEVASDIMAAAKAMQVRNGLQSKAWSDACLGTGTESQLSITECLSDAAEQCKGAARAIMDPGCAGVRFSAPDAECSSAWGLPRNRELRQRSWHLMWRVLNLECCMCSGTGGTPRCRSQPCQRRWCMSARSRARA